VFCKKERHFLHGTSFADLKMICICSIVAC